MSLLVDEEKLRKLLEKFDDARHYSVPFKECVDDLINECKKVLDK